MWIRVWDWKEFLYFRGLRIIIKPTPFSFDVWRGKFIESGRAGYYLLKVISDHIRSIFHLLREGVNPGNEVEVMCRRIIREQSDTHISVRSEIYFWQIWLFFLKDFSEKINMKK